MTLIDRDGWLVGLSSDEEDWEALTSYMLDPCDHAKYGPGLCVCFQRDFPVEQFQFSREGIMIHLGPKAYEKYCAWEVDLKKERKRNG